MGRAPVRNKKKGKPPVYFFAFAGLVCAVLLLVGIISIIASLFTSPSTEKDDTQSQGADVPAVAQVTPTPTVEPESTVVRTDYTVEDLDLSVDGIDFTPGTFSLDNMFDTTILKESEAADDEYINEIVFVGESTTYGLYHYETLPKGKDTTHVWTPTSGTLMLTNANADVGKVNVYNPNTSAYEDMLISDAAGLYKPKYMVITLGLNGVSFYIDEQADYYIGEYVKLINEIRKKSPDTKIMVQSVFPVAQSYEYSDSISNLRLNKANYLFAKMCEQMQVKFLNSAPIFMNESGDMDESYHNGDGLHLSAEALNMEIDFIKKHKYQ